MLLSGHTWCWTALSLEMLLLLLLWDEVLRSSGGHDSLCLLLSSLEARDSEVWNYGWSSTHTEELWEGIMMIAIEPIVVGLENHHLLLVVFTWIVIRLIHQGVLLVANISSTSSHMHIDDVRMHQDRVVRALHYLMMAMGVEGVMNDIVLLGNVVDDWGAQST